MGGVQDPDNVGHHDNGWYADASYGRRVPQQRMVQRQQRDRERRSAGEVSPGPSSLALPTNREYPVSGARHRDDEIHGIYGGALNTGHFGT